MRARDEMELMRARNGAVHGARVRLHDTHVGPQPGCMEGHCRDLTIALAEAEADVLFGEA